MYALLSILAITSASFIGPVSSLQDDEVEIPVSELPEIVRKAADEALPRVRWEEAWRDVVDGKTRYSLAGKDSRDRDVDIYVSSAGEVVFASISIRQEDVPDPVRQALKKAAPDFKPTHFSEVMRDGKLEGYAFEAESPDKVAAAFVDLDGKKVDLCDKDGNPL